MSISQINKAFAGVLNNGSKPTHYFMYDNQFLEKDFQEQIAASKATTMGWLPGWTWHVNDLRRSSRVSSQPPLSKLILSFRETQHPPYLQAV